MDIKINTRDAALVAGGLAAGLFIGFGLIKQAKKEFRKELLDKETKALKKEIKLEIKQEIRESIDAGTIKKEIKEQIENSIIDDTLKEMTDKTAKFMAKVDIRLEDYEKQLNKISKEVMNFDARVGKLVNGAIKTIAGAAIRRGEDDED